MSSSDPLGFNPITESLLARLPETWQPEVDAKMLAGAYNFGDEIQKAAGHFVDDIQNSPSDAWNDLRRMQFLLFYRPSDSAQAAWDARVAAKQPTFGDQAAHRLGQLATSGAGSAAYIGVHVAGGSEEDARKALALGTGISSLLPALTAVGSRLRNPAVWEGRFREPLTTKAPASSTAVPPQKAPQPSTSPSNVYPIDPRNSAIFAKQHRPAKIDGVDPSKIEEPFGQSYKMCAVVDESRKDHAPGDYMAGDTLASGQEGATTQTSSDGAFALIGSPGPAPGWPVHPSKHEGWLKSLTRSEGDQPSTADKAAWLTQFGFSLSNYEAAFIKSGMGYLDGLREGLNHGEQATAQALADLNNHHRLWQIANDAGYENAWLRALPWTSQQHTVSQLFDRLRQDPSLIPAYANELRALVAQYPQEAPLPYPKTTPPLEKMSDEQLSRHVWSLAKLLQMNDAGIDLNGKGQPLSAHAIDSLRQETRFADTHIAMAQLVHTAYRAARQEQVRRTTPADIEIAQRALVDILKESLSADEARRIEQAQKPRDSWQQDSWERDLPNRLQSAQQRLSRAVDDKGQAQQEVDSLREAILENSHRRSDDPTYDNLFRYEGLELEIQKALPGVADSAKALLVELHGRFDKHLDAAKRELDSLTYDLRELQRHKADRRLAQEPPPPPQPSAAALATFRAVTANGMWSVSEDDLAHMAAEINASRNLPERVDPEFARQRTQLLNQAFEVHGRRAELAKSFADGQRRIIDELIGDDSSPGPSSPSGPPSPTGPANSDGPLSLLAAWAKRMLN